MNSASELRWTVATEAALAFSVPTWSLAVNQAWPDYFTPIAVLLGATAALLICHVLPAICAPTITRFFATRSGRVLYWPIGVVLGICAAKALLDISSEVGTRYEMYRYLAVEIDTVGKRVVFALPLVCLLLCLTLAARSYRWQRPLILTGIVVSSGLGVVAFVLQFRGLWGWFDYGVSEGRLRDSLEVAKGMLLAMGPASILAYRIGRMGLSTKQIWRAGLWGVWVPSVAAVTLISVDMMCGARLYWRPGYGIDWGMAFISIVRYQPGDTIPIHLLVALSWLVPAFVWAIWLMELTRGLAWRWQRPLALVMLTVAAYWLGLYFDWHTYPTHLQWLWLIPCGSLLLFLIHLATHRSPGKETGKETS